MISVPLSQWYKTQTLQWLISGNTNVGQWASVLILLCWLSDCWPLAWRGFNDVRDVGGRKVFVGRAVGWDCEISVRGLHTATPPGRPTRTRVDIVELPWRYREDSLLRITKILLSKPAILISNLTESKRWFCVRISACLAPVNVNIYIFLRWPPARSHANILLSTVFGPHPLSSQPNRAELDWNAGKNILFSGCDKYFGWKQSNGALTKSDLMICQSKLKQYL